MRWYRLVVLGLTLLLAAAPALGLAGEAAKKEPAPAKTERIEETPQETTQSTEGPATAETPAAAKEPAGLVGTVVAVVPASRTLVVDVPLGTDVLRVGAAVTETTTIVADGAAASFDSLKEGARVRLQFRRVATGDEATMVEVLRGRQG